MLDMATDQGALSSSEEGFSPVLAPVTASLDALESVTASACFQMAKRFQRIGLAFDPQALSPVET